MADIAIEGMAASEDFGGVTKVDALKALKGDYSYSYVDKAGNITGEHIGADSLKGGFSFGDAFSADNIGGTMQGIGSIAGAAAGMYDAYNKKKYQDKVFGMEEKRVKRETERQDKQQAAYDKVFG